MQHGDPFVAAAKYSDLIDRMRSIAPCCNIVVCAVPYRLNSKSFNQRADQLNSTLRLMCVRDPKCQFWDINPSATQANYRKDGLHFNFSGINQFANNLVHKVKQRNFHACGLKCQI